MISWKYVDWFPKPLPEIDTSNSSSVPAPEKEEVKPIPVKISVHQSMYDYTVDIRVYTYNKMEEMTLHQSLVTTTNQKLVAKLRDFADRIEKMI